MCITCDINLTDVHVYGKGFMLTRSVAGVRMVSRMVAAWDGAARTIISFRTCPCNVMQTILSHLTQVCAARSTTLLRDKL